MQKSLRNITGIHKKPNWSKLVIPGLVIALISLYGGLRIIHSHAATYAASSEAESGLLSGKGTVAADTDASGGQAVAFGSTSPTDGTAAQPAGSIGGKWNMIFNDEFNGTSVDQSKWLPCVNAGWTVATAKAANTYPVPCVGFAGVAEKTYLASNVSESGGDLHLKAKKEADGSFTSGAITSSENAFGYNQPSFKPFNYLYGYLEVRMKAPINSGMWPAVWQMPALGSGGHDEMDLMEVIGGYAQSTLHGPISQGNPNWGHTTANLTDFGSTYHTFAANWAPNKLEWYYDGKLMAYDVPIQAGAVPSIPEFVQANMQLSGPGSPFAGVLSPNQTYPVSEDIDYIRVWQRAP